VEIAEDFTELVRKKAEKHYRQGRFFCGESVLRGIVDVSGQKERRALVALASGFGTGMGEAGCACGAVVGGIMALGLFFGRTMPGDPKVNACMALARELHDQFRAKHRSVCCRVLNRGVVHDSPEQQENCAQRTADAAGIAAAIIARELKRQARDAEKKAGP